MNLFPNIAKMLNVEIGEVFNAKITGDVAIHTTENKPTQYRITLKRLEYFIPNANRWSPLSIERFLSGECEIIKLPYKPKPQERFFYVSISEPATVEEAYWSSNMNTIDYALLFCGNVFRTEAEAEKHKCEIYEKLTGKKWENTGESEEKS